nr:hypothetical protein CFP56_52309 [Quercus suber]
MSICVYIGVHVAVACVAAMSQTALVLCARRRAKDGSLARSQVGRYGRHTIFWLASRQVRHICMPHLEVAPLTQKQSALPCIDHDIVRPDRTDARVLALPSLLDSARVRRDLVAIVEGRSQGTVPGTFLADKEMDDTPRLHAYRQAAGAAGNTASSIPVPMDIRTWLETAADRDAPDPNKDCFVPKHLQSGSGAHGLGHQGYRGKRKRSSSESLVSEARSYLHPHRPTRRSTQVWKSAKKSRRLRSPSGAHVSEDHASPKLYERRPRRKTRSDLYEAEPKRSKKEMPTYAHVSSKPKRRKSNHHGGGARTSRLMQDFHLRTGPKDKRLTVRERSGKGL